MADAFPLAPLEPVRNPQATLPDLIDVLLNRGVVVHLDLIISVADIPLIGVSLKAAIAGIETMLEYGMMRSWDEQTRAWVQRSISRTVPFLPDEELIARMAGACESSGYSSTWRPGTVYLTNRRLFVFRREPREMLWEARLDAIRAIETYVDNTIGGQARTRVRLRTGDGSILRLSASDPERLVRLAGDEIAARDARVDGIAPATTLLREGQLWYYEPRAGGAVWRGGQARIDAATGFSWKAPIDARAAVQLRPEDIRGIHLESDRAPTGNIVLVIDVPWGSARFAAHDITQWADATAAFATTTGTLAAAEPGAHMAGDHDAAQR